MNEVWRARPDLPLLRSEPLEISARSLARREMRPADEERQPEPGCYTVRRGMRWAGWPGYGPGMPSITVPEITARTTTDGTAHSHGVVAATGRTPADALDELDAAAHARASSLAEALPDGSADNAGPGAWGLELVNVRLVPGPADGD